MKFKIGFKNPVPLAEKYIGVVKSLPAKFYAPLIKRAGDFEPRLLFI